MKLQLSEPVSDHLELTPLIDIIFQLVIFFMIASTFVEDYGFNIHLPAASRPDVVAADEAMWVLIREDGTLAARPGAESYECADDLVADLKGYAAARAREQKTAILVIKADRRTPYERVIQVWNAARLAGVANISFKVENRPHG